MAYGTVLMKLAKKYGPKAVKEAKEAVKGGSKKITDLIKSGEMEKKIKTTFDKQQASLAGTKRLMKESSAKLRKKQEEIKKRREERKQKNMASGGKTSPLKPVPSDNKGLAKLPTPVRNNMGFAKAGGQVKKLKKGGKVKRMSCPVDGMAKRGKTRIRKKGR